MSIKEFLEKEHIDYMEHEELVKHATYKVGGQCDFFVTPSSLIPPRSATTCIASFRVYFSSFPVNTQYLL